MSPDTISAVQPIPLADCAALDGFAVAASATLGATEFTRLLLGKADMRVVRI